jgi:hypothetical protein
MIDVTVEGRARKELMEGNEAKFFTYIHSQSSM